tara:strand:+ start:119 stop:850 length:732 start_codon:yes stop_codon:yes gene_type:complete
MNIKLIFILSLLSLHLFSQKNFSEKSVLIYSFTDGFVHHDAIKYGEKLIIDLGKKNDFNVKHAKTQKAFMEEKLANFDAIIFLCTTLDVLDKSGENELKNFINSGKGFVGIHSASDTEYDWPWFGRLVGAYFFNHPEGTHSATIHTTSSNSFFTSHLEKKWEIEDEWYNFNYRNLDIEPLLMLDEKTYEGGLNGENHPITWFHEFDGGRSFYTGLGHRKETYQDIRFQKLLEKGILYAIYGLN